MFKVVKIMISTIIIYSLHCNKSLLSKVRCKKNIIIERIRDRLMYKLLRILSKKMKRCLKRFQCNYLTDRYFLVYNIQIKEWLIVPSARIHMYYYGHEENVVNFVKKIVKKNTVFVNVVLL